MEHSLSEYYLGENVMSYFPGNVKRIPSELVGVWRKVVLDRGLHIRLGIRLKGTVPVKNKGLSTKFYHRLTFGRIFEKNKIILSD